MVSVTRVYIGAASAERKGRFWYGGTPALSKEFAIQGFKC
jgi:hypothetical protein